MFGRVPAYTNTAHFRAPYKNAYIAGYGDSDPATTTTSDEHPTGNMYVDPAFMRQHTIYDNRGYTLVKPDTLPILMKALTNYGVTFIGGPTNIHEIAFFSIEMLQLAKQGEQSAKNIVDNFNAAKWITSELKAGKVVFGSAILLASIMTGMEPPSLMNQLASLPAATPEAQEAAKFPGVVVFGGDPDKVMAGGSALAMLTSPVGIAVIAALTVGGVYLYTRKKGRY